MVSTKLYAVTVDVLGPCGKVRTMAVVPANNRADAALLGRNRVAREYPGSECVVVKLQKWMEN